MIDNEKTDTFDPFLFDKTVQDVPPEKPQDFLSQITFEGDESLQRDFRVLCLKHKDIFSDELAPEPSAIKPFRLDVDRQKWERTCNRGPVRPQSSKKEVEIEKALKEMLASGVIERSDAVYYSHPVIHRIGPFNGLLGRVPPRYLMHKISLISIASRPQISKFSPVLYILLRSVSYIQVSSSLVEQSREQDPFPFKFEKDFII